MSDGTSQQVTKTIDDIVIGLTEQRVLPAGLGIWDAIFGVRNCTCKASYNTRTVVQYATIVLLVVQYATARSTV